MKPRTTITTPMLVLLSVCPTPTAIAADPNLVRNPGFEQGAQSWQLLDYASSVVSSPTHGGQGALRLVNDFDGTTGVHNARQSNVPGVLGGKEYRFEVWVSGDNVQGIGAGGKPLAVLKWKDAAGGSLRTEMYMWAPYGTYGYRAMAIHSEAPAAAAAADVTFRSWWDCTDGATSWDDISLTPRPLPTAGLPALVTYQAEDSSAHGASHFDDAHPGFTGTGYRKMEDNGSFIEWDNVAGGGERLLTFRYAMEASDLDLEVLVNGVTVGTLRFVATGSPDSWATATTAATLLAGANTVRLLAGSGFMKPSIDRLVLFGEHAGVDASTPADAGRRDAGGAYDAVVADDTGAVDDAATGTLRGHVRINCGSNSFDVPGWLRDDAFADGGGDWENDSVVSIAGVENAAQPDVYRSVRFLSPHRYDIPVEDGSYLLRMHFADRYDMDRSLNYAAEGVVILSDFDVTTAAGGVNIAVVRDFVVQVVGGDGLQLEASGSNDVFEAGLELIPISEADAGNDGGAGLDTAQLDASPPDSPPPEGHRPDPQPRDTSLSDLRRTDAPRASAEAGGAPGDTEGDRITPYACGCAGPDRSGAGSVGLALLLLALLGRRRLTSQP